MSTPRINGIPVDLAIVAAVAERDARRSRDLAVVAARVLAEPVAPSNHCILPTPQSARRPNIWRLIHG